MLYRIEANSNICVSYNSERNAGLLLLHIVAAFIYAEELVHHKEVLLQLLYHENYQVLLANRHWCNIWPKKLQCQASIVSRSDLTG